MNTRFNALKFALILTLFLPLPFPASLLDFPYFSTTPLLLPGFHWAAFIAPLYLFEQTQDFITGSFLIVLPYIILFFYFFLFFLMYKIFARARYAPEILLSIITVQILAFLILISVVGLNDSDFQLSSLSVGEKILILVGFFIIVGVSFIYSGAIINFAARKSNILNPGFPFFRLRRNGSGNAALQPPEQER
jgi:hypothetical protein